MSEDGTLSGNGQQFSLTASAYELTLLVVNGYSVDRLAMPALVNVRELLVAAGRILSTLAEMPKTLCLASVVEMAVRKLVDSGAFTKPRPAPEIWSEVEGSFDISGSQLTMATRWCSLTVFLKSPGTDLAAITVHQREHLRALTTEFGWLISGLIQQPTARPIWEQFAPVADAIEQLTMALSLFDQKMLGFDELTETFAEYSPVPVAQVLACATGR